MDYRELDPAKAYELTNGGGVALVCSAGRAGGDYDLAPVAWHCPLDYEPVSRFLIVLDPAHRSAENIRSRGEFVLAMPTWEQKDLVLKAGSVSGREKDKYRAFSIASFPARAVDALVPEGVAGWAECRLLEARPLGSVVMIAGELLRAAAVAEPWRLVLHHAGGSLFFRSGETLE